VNSKVHKIDVDANGNVTCGFKGWGRPADLNSGATQPSGDEQEPAWIAAMEKNVGHGKHGKHVEDNDR
jgi:hypothetical protein